jgi:rhamnosyltransferase
MPSTHIVAIVVTYHPDAQVLQNLTALRPQVDQLIVVDNGSTPAELTPLRAAAASLHFPLLENGENLGIATALNQGVRQAQSLGAAWVFLFDQDSAVTPGYVPTMLAAFEATPAAARLGILVPRYVDRRFGVVLPPPALDGTQLAAATTSGSLTPLAVFARAGLFADELFIDGVDYEFSLRVRSLGYTIAECPAATLLHAAGDPTYHRFLGSRPFQAANYSPIRRYYQERNKLLIARRYLTRFAPFLLSQFVISAKDLIKIFIAEPGKRAKIAFFLRGWRDGLLNRSGKFQPRL